VIEGLLNALSAGFLAAAEAVMALLNLLAVVVLLVAIGGVAGFLAVQLATARIRPL
jgi:hypothetical protein